MLQRGAYGSGLARCRWTGLTVGGLRLERVVDGVEDLVGATLTIPGIESTRTHWTLDDSPTFDPSGGCVTSVAGQRFAADLDEGDSETISSLIDFRDTLSDTDTRFPH